MSTCCIGNLRISEAYLSYVLVINLCFQINFLIDHHCKTQSEFSDISKVTSIFDVYAGWYSICDDIYNICSNINEQNSQISRGNEKNLFHDYSAHKPAAVTARQHAWLRNTICYNTWSPKLSKLSTIFGPVSVPFRPHYNHCRIMAMCVSERLGPKLQNEWSFVKIG